MMDKKEFMDKYIGLIVLLCSILIVIVAFTGLVTWAMFLSNERSKTVFDEGYIESMESKPSGHFLGGTDYWVTINNKEWEIGKTDYHTFNVGDYVEVRDGSGVVKLEMVNKTGAKK